jgi:hypothetical protein
MCLRLATGATWYVSKSQIHENLSVPKFADHLKSLTASFDSQLADVWNPLVRQLGATDGRRHRQLEAAFTVEGETTDDEGMSLEHV